MADRIGPEPRKPARRKEWKNVLEPGDIAYDAMARSARARREINAKLNEEEKQQGGDDDIFVHSDWDDIEAVTEVPLGIDGILPESGVVWLHGPAGHGKTILAYWVLLRYSRANYTSGVYECEMGQERSKGLFLNLGAKWRNLRKIHYYRADDPTDIIDLVAHGRALDRRLRAVDSDVLLYDAANPLMAAAVIAGKRLSENEASDVRTFVNTAMRPVTIRGGLAIILDHDKKDGNGQRGSSDKPASGDVILSVKATTRFARGRNGVIRVTCDKDRNGTIESDSILDIVVVCEENGSIALKPGKWVGPSQDLVKQALDSAKTQGKILKALSDSGPMTPTKIAKETELSPESVRSALRRGCKGKDDDKFIKVGDGEWDVKP